MYANIISSDIISMRNFYILKEYCSLDEAKKHLESDMQNFKSKYPKFWKANYPFACATVSNYL